MRGHYRKRKDRSELELEFKIPIGMDRKYIHVYMLRMRGMFALAIYDKRRGSGRERLLLARDHLGIKPLLYARVGSTFLFASEMKAMLASGLIERQFDPESLRLLMTHGSITQPRTALSGVKMLLPGHRLIVESGKDRMERFWKLDIDRISSLRNNLMNPRSKVLGPRCRSRCGCRW